MQTLTSFNMMPANQAEQAGSDLPRVLLENYLMLSAALENQNLGRLQDMLLYQQRVHDNLLQVAQHIEDAPAVAMTISQPPPPPPQQQQQQQEVPIQQQEQQQDPQQPDAAAAAAAAQHAPAASQALLHRQQPQQPAPQQQQPPAWLGQVNRSVSQLLQSLGLGEFVARLEEQRVDLAALQLMEERHLRELGLPLGAVVKIRAALAAQAAQQQ